MFVLGDEDTTSYFFWKLSQFMRINLLISLEKIRNLNVFRCFKGGYESDN